MFTMRHTRVMSALLMLASAYGSTSAAVLQINGIAPFDTNLGTLTQVTVVLDPIAVPTSVHQSGFIPIGSHAHIASPAPVLVGGLGSFPFAPVQSSFSSSGSFDSHSHLVNLLPSLKVFTGGNLAWFLNPASVPINSVVIPPFPTSTEEDHDHIVNLPPVVPITTYTFNPIPEPSTGLLAFSVAICVLGRRPRPAGKLLGTSLSPISSPTTRKCS